MSDLLIHPDVTKLLVGFWRAQPEVLALIDAAQIRGQLGDDPEYPVIRITRITDTPAVPEPASMLDQVTMQLDVWGGNNRQAERIAATCRATLLSRGPNYANDEGVITKVRSVGTSNDPDDAQDPPRERYIVRIDVWTRPLYDQEIT